VATGLLPPTSTTNAPTVPASNRAALALRLMRHDPSLFA
jgi:hypothetical protein